MIWEQQEYPDTIVVPIHCEGFKFKICASGFDAAFLSINKYILKKENVPKEKGLVNLFAPTTVSFADQKEMEHMFAQIFIGVLEWAAKLGIPTIHVLDGKRSTMGYDGLLYLGNKIADQLQNPGFNVKLAKHVKLPYKDSWYEESAFKYIEGGV